MYGLLIAEDELIERMVLKKTLEKRLGDQCRIFEAQNGREAVELFDREEIQIAILDIAMPGMNGIEAAEAIRKKSEDCCLIFLTAYDRFEYAKKAVSVGAMEYLLKPYSQKEVLAVAEEAIRLTAKRLRLNQLCREMEEGEMAASREAGEARGRGGGACGGREATGDGEVRGGSSTSGGSQPPTAPPKDEITDRSKEEPVPEEASVNRLSLMASMIQEYIQKNYMREISMSDGARALNYSEPYFCKMFKQQFGQNFTSYVAEYRIGEAKKLLMQPNVNVKEVGERVGYPDSNYFTKVFKRMTGESPSEYRSQIIKELGT